MAARIKPAGSTQAERDLISLGRIEALSDGIMGNAITCPSCNKPHKISNLDSSVVAVMRMRYDKLRPTLQAVEQTNIDPQDKLDENQILTKLGALIDAHPDLLQRALAARAKVAETAVSPVAVTPITHPQTPDATDNTVPISSIGT